MKRITPWILICLFLAAPGAVIGQECGPGCPACSGKATGDLLSPGTILAHGLVIPDGEEETTVLRLSYGFLSWMDAGIGYAIDSEEIIWNARVQPIVQDLEGWRPGLILGTGSVQTGGSDQSGYIQIIKRRELIENRLELSLAGGFATDIPDFDEDWVLGSVSITLFDKVSPFYNYDGVNSHAGLSVFTTDWLTLSGYYLEMETLAFSASVQWDLLSGIE